MAAYYTVQQGDGMSRIGSQHGFFWQTLWNLPENESLKQTRQHPEFLLPGDTVYIPDKREQAFTGATDQRHRYRLKGVPAKFSVRLLDEDQQPRAGLPYRLELDSGKLFTGQTDREGWIRCFVPPDARTGKLALHDGQESYNINFGYVDPFNTISGAKAVLRNLGYDPGEPTDQMNGAMQMALAAFQSESGLPATGLLDAGTVNALKSAYLG